MLDRFDDEADEGIIDQPRILTPMEHDFEQYEICYQQTMDLIDYQAALESMDDEDYTREFHHKGESLGIEMESFTGKVSKALKKAAAATKKMLQRLFKLIRRIVARFIDFMNRLVGRKVRKDKDEVVEEGQKVQLPMNAWEVLGRPTDAVDYGIRCATATLRLGEIKSTAFTTELRNRLGEMNALRKELKILAEKMAEKESTSDSFPSIEVQESYMDSGQRDAFNRLTGKESNNRYLQAMSNGTTMMYSEKNGEGVVNDHENMRGEGPITVTIDNRALPNTTISRFAVNWEIGKLSPVKEVPMFDKTREVIDLNHRLGDALLLAPSGEIKEIGENKLISRYEDFVMGLGDYPNASLEGLLRAIAMHHIRGLMLSIHHEHHVIKGLKDAYDAF